MYVRYGAATAVSAVAASATSVTLLAANLNRSACYIENRRTSATMYVKFGATATATEYTFSLAAGEKYEMPGTAIYTGIITGIWDTATGGCQATEIF